MHIVDAVRLYRKSEALFRERFSHPVLLRRDEQELDEHPSYQTGMLARPALAAMMAAARTMEDSGSLDLDDADAEKGRAGDIISVTKRNDGPFAERIGVGRARNADVCLPLPKVSKYHAYFTLDGAVPAGVEDSKAYCLSDAGSRNGTKLEGEAIAPRESVLIQDGAEVEFGPYRFLFFSADGFEDLVSRRAGRG